MFDYIFYPHLVKRLMATGKQNDPKFDIFKFAETLDRAESDLKWYCDNAIMIHAEYPHMVIAIKDKLIVDSTEIKDVNAFIERINNRDDRNEIMVRYIEKEKVYYA